MCCHVPHKYNINIAVVICAFIYGSIQPHTLTRETEAIGDFHQIASADSKIGLWHKLCMHADSCAHIEGQKEIDGKSIKLSTGLLS